MGIGQTKVLANNKLYHNRQKGHDIKVYQIVTIDNVRFVTFKMKCQDWDGVYLNIYKKRNILIVLKTILYIIYRRKMRKIVNRIKLYFIKRKNKNQRYIY